jgi:hypothetical protein
MESSFWAREFLESILYQVAINAKKCYQYISLQHDSTNSKMVCHFEIILVINIMVYLYIWPLIVYNDIYTCTKLSYV